MLNAPQTMNIALQCPHRTAIKIAPMEEEEHARWCLIDQFWTWNSWVEFGVVDQCQYLRSSSTKKSDLSALPIFTLSILTNIPKYRFSWMNYYDCSSFVQKREVVCPTCSNLLVLNLSFQQAVMLFFFFPHFSSKSRKACMAFTFEANGALSLLCDHCCGYS